MARLKEFDRNDVLKKAMWIFWEKGYNGTSVNDLTCAMSISRSSLYETFGDKDALFLEALQNYLDKNSQKRTEILSSAKTVNEGMNKYFNNVMTFLLSDNNPGGCFLTNTLTDLGTLNEEIKSIIKLNLEKQEDDFYNFFEKGRQNGEISSDKDSRALARFVIGITRGISAISKLQKDQKVLEDIVKIALSKFQ